MVKNKYKIKFILLWVLVFTLIIPFSSYGIDGQIKIGQTSTFPIIIDQPGDYILTTNIVVSNPNIYGIQINSDEVTLDLNGHSLIGPGGDIGPASVGIYSSHKKNIAVMNGTVKKFFCGLNLCGGYHLVKKVKANHNLSNGIMVKSCTVIDCTADHNGANGIRAISSTIARCTTKANGLHGIDADSSSITNCTAHFNGLHGINGANKSRIEDNSLQKNGGYGLYLDSNNNYATKNDVRNNKEQTHDQKK